MKRKYFLAVVTLLYVLRIYCAYRRAVIPFEIDYEEGNVLNAGLRLLRHQTPYPQLGSFPYIVNPYGPIGYLLAEFGIFSSGLSLLGPRLLELVSGIFIAFLIAGLIRHCGGKGHIGWLFGLLYLCSSLVWNWYPLLRVDFLAIFLSLLGLYIFVAFPRFRLFSAVLFATAILTKPTALAAPVACAVELATEKRVRQLSGFILLSGGLLGTTALFLGKGFRSAMLYTHPDPYSFIRAAHLYLVASEGAVFPLATIGLACFAGLRPEPRSRLMLIYVATTSVTALTAGKLGSETNHFLEWTAAICILAGLALSHLVKIRNKLALPLLAGSLLMAALFAALPQMKVVSGPGQDECANAYSFVKAFPGDRILSEDVASLVVADKTVLVSNPFVVTQLSRQIPWSQGTMEEMVKRREFDLILLGGEVQNFDPHSGRWSQEFIRNVSTQYQLKSRFQCSPNLVAAYVPRQQEAK